MVIVSLCGKLSTAKSRFPLSQQTIKILRLEFMARNEVRNLPKFLYTGIENSDQWNEEERSGVPFTTAVKMAVPLKPKDMVLVVKMGYRNAWEIFTKFGFGGLYSSLNREQEDRS